MEAAIHEPCNVGPRNQNNDGSTEQDRRDTRVPTTTTQRDQDNRGAGNRDNGDGCEQATSEPDPRLRIRHPYQIRNGQPTKKKRTTTEKQIVVVV